MINNFFAKPKADDLEEVARYGKKMRQM